MTQADNVLPVDFMAAAGQVPTPDEAPSTWQPQDLSDALNGVDIEPPRVMQRDDGAHLVYPGRIHWFQGESESLKSWSAQVAVVQELDKGNAVLYIDMEDEARGVVSRLLAMGASPDAIRERLHYIRPEEPLIDRHGRATVGHVILGQLLEANTYSLCVIDGVTEAMTVEDLDLLSNADSAAWMRRLPKRISRLGPAVICIDHVVKSAENRGRYAIGAQHKLAGVDGATYSFTMVAPLGRADKEPITAQVNIDIQKDRPGYVRSKSENGRAGALEITSWPDGTITAKITASPTIPAPPLDLVGRIMDYLCTYDGSTQRNIEDHVDGKAATIRAALAWLCDDVRGWVKVEQKGRSHLHWVTSTGRAEWSS